MNSNTIEISGPDGKLYTITNAPDNPSEAVAMDLVREAIRRGVRTIPYSEEPSQSAPSQSAPSQSARNQDVQPRFSQAVDAARYQEMARNPEAAGKPTPLDNGPRTDAGGIAGATLRGAGPYGVGALAGFTAGGPLGAGLGAAAVGISKAVNNPQVTEFINRTLGTNFVDAREGLRQIFTNMGVPEPDTATEQYLQRVAETLAATGGAIGLGAGLAASAPTLGPAATTAQGAGQMVSSNPMQQMVGAAGGEAGSEVMVNAADRLNAGPGLRSAMSLSGNILGDVLASGAPGIDNTPIGQISQQDVDMFRRQMDKAGRTTEAVRAAVREGQEPAIRSLMDSLGVSREVAQRALNEQSGGLRRAASRIGLADSDVRVLTQAGVDRDVAVSALERARQVEVPVYRSDAAPPISSRDQQSQAIRESLGMGAKRAAQDEARVTRIREELSALGLTPGEAGMLTDNGQRTLIDIPLADSFLAPRRTALTSAVDAKKTVLGEVGDAEFNPEETVAYIDETIEHLTRLGDRGANVGIDQTIDETSDVASSRNEYGEIISWLNDQRSLLTNNKSIRDAEQLRERLGQSYRAQGGLGDVPEYDQSIINDTVSRVSRDIASSIESNGGDVQSWSQANETISDLMSDLNNEALRGLLRKVEKGQTAIEANSEVITSMVNSSDASVVRQVMERLDYRGQDLATAAFLEDAMHRATRDGTVLSANNFSEIMQQQLRRRGVILSPERNQRLEGITRLLRMTRRAEDSLNRQPIDPTVQLSGIPGIRYALARIISGGVQGAGIVGGSVLGMRNLALIYESPETRDALLELASDGVSPRRQDELASIIVRVMQGEMTPAAAPEERRNDRYEVTREQLTPGIQADVWR